MTQLVPEFCCILPCNVTILRTKTITEADPDRAIRGAWFFLEKQSDFKTICFKNNRKIPRRDSKQKLQNMVKRKITRMK
jgi:hypothetical protein